MSEKYVEGEVLSSGTSKKKAPKGKVRSPAAEVINEAYQELGASRKAVTIVTAGTGALVSAPVHTIRRTALFAKETLESAARNAVGIVEDVAGTYRFVRADFTLHQNPEKKADFVEAGLGMAASGQHEKLRSETGFSLDDLAKMAKELAMVQAIPQLQ